MSTPIPMDLWHRICAHLAAYETCQITIHQHKGMVCKIDLQVTVKARNGLVEHDVDKNVMGSTLIASGIE